MLLKIDFESTVPIYVQLKRQIIRGIAKGELKANDELPSVRQLAEDIGINMHTVNKAYNLLKLDGFVVMDRRKGAVISNVSKDLSEEYRGKFKEEMDALITEAYCRGISKGELLNFCESIFESYDK